MTTDIKQLKTAIVYDKVSAAYGGAEQVLIALNQLFPKAPLFTSVYKQKQAKWAKIYPRVITSFLQKLPGASSHYRWYLPLMPLAFESLDLSEYDLIISVTSGEAKGIITKPDQLHLCYLLTPPRYLYSHQREYLNSRKILSLPGIKNLVKLFLKYLRWWDQVASYRPDLIIPISHLVAERAEKYYSRQTAPVIYPPIDIPFSKISKAKKLNQKLAEFNLPQKYLLVVSRLVAYKEIDLAIAACLATKQNLVIVGTGPELKRLKTLTRNLLGEFHDQASKIIFLKNQPQAIVNYLYQRAEGLLMPAKEDFGITALQANYFKTPVILHYQSGAAELIKDPEHGIHIDAATLPEITKAILQLKQTKFDKKKLKALTQTYTTSKFLYNVESVILNHQKTKQRQHDQ